MTRLSRRAGLIAIAAGYPLAFHGTAALAQNPPAGGRDWLDAVKQHHRLIAEAFEQLLARDVRGFEQRDLQLRNLDQLLTAHSLAEETVLYPALALADMQGQAERLYMEEAHVKIELARTEMLAPGPRHERDWAAPARKLRDMVMQHAIQHEENELFAKLRDRLDPRRNLQLRDAYTREFSRVLPIVARR